MSRGARSVTIVGLGYVGLSTAICLASRRFRVLGVDVDERRIEQLRRGKSPIHEKGLAPLLRRAIKKKFIRFESNYDHVADSATIFITVGTPSKDDGSIDTTYVESASKEIGYRLKTKGYRLVIVKSTVIPGTTENLVLSSLEKGSGKRAGKAFGLASNPEFLHEGTAIDETLNPDALVVGGHDKKSSDALLRLWRLFYGKLPQTIVTSPSNAEMMKYAINGGRAVQLSFVNTVADLCTRIPGCNYDEVRKGLSLVAKMDQRYLAAGMGFGGSCLSKDSRALGSTLKSSGVGDDLVASALRVNQGQVDEAIRLAESLCGAMEGRRVSVLGLAFKAETDDVRESTAISLIRTLIRKGAEVTAYDPAAMGNARQLLGSQISFAKNLRDCIRNSECAFVATAWEEFKKLRPGDFKALMVSPVVVDGRRIYDTQRFEKAGVKIATIGTGSRQGKTITHVVEEPKKRVARQARALTKPTHEKEERFEYKGVIGPSGATSL